MIFPKGIEDLLKDNISGSEKLLEMLNIFLIKNNNFLNDDLLLSQLKNRLTDFAAITNQLHKILNSNHSERKSIIEKNLFSVNHKYELLYSNFINEIKPKFPITISNSYTAQRIFEKYKTDKNDFELTILESRPMFEGRILAEQLSKSGIKVKLITEAQTAKEIQKCDCAIIGADKILNNGNVVNKIGSQMLAIICRYNKIPFYVLALQNKIVSTSLFEQAKKDTSEILSSSNKMIKITNYYFEEVNSSLITKIITD